MKIDKLISDLTKIMEIIDYDYKLDHISLYVKSINSKQIKLLDKVLSDKYNYNISVYGESIEDMLEVRVIL